MYLTPFKLYLLVWLPGLTAHLVFDNPLIHNVSAATTALILSPVIVYAIFGLLAKSERIKATANGRSYRLSTIQCICSQIDSKKARRTLALLVWTWLFLYLIMTLFSGGVPLFWVMTGDPRTYVDFGVPTLGGLCNMLRAFSAALAFLLLSHHEVSAPQKRRLVLLVIFLLFTAFGLETGRGNGVVLLLHPLAFFFLGRTLDRAIFLKMISATIVFLLFLGYIQHVRYGGDWEKIKAYTTSQGFTEVESTLSVLMIPAVTYLVSPVQNLNLTVAGAQTFSINPEHSLRMLLPTVVRQLLVGEAGYGELVSEANNVTSSFTPLVRDFGYLGAILAGIFISIVIGWSWLQATRGRLQWALLWPALFMVIALSFFNLFFTSLVVVMYGPLAWMVAKLIRRLPEESHNRRSAYPSVYLKPK